jgi:hypothetical protein
VTADRDAAPINLDAIAERLSFSAGPLMPSSPVRVTAAERDALVAAVRAAQEFMSDDLVEPDAVLVDLRAALAPFGDPS